MDNLRICILNQTTTSFTIFSETMERSYCKNIYKLFEVYFSIIGSALIFGNSLLKHGLIDQKKIDNLEIVDYN